jgi:hypothetical protein
MKRGNLTPTRGRAPPFLLKSERCPRPPTDAHRPPAQSLGRAPASACSHRPALARMCHPASTRAHHRQTSAHTRRHPASARARHLDPGASPTRRRPPPTPGHRSSYIALDRWVPDTQPPVLLQPDMAGSSTPLPPLQPTPLRAPPCLGRPATPVQVRSSRRAVASMPRFVPHRSLAFPSSSMTPPDHWSPSSTSVQNPPGTQLELLRCSPSPPPMNLKFLEMCMLQCQIGCLMFECQIGCLNLKFQEIRMNLCYI